MSSVLMYDLINVTKIQHVTSTNLNLLSVICTKHGHHGMDNSWYCLLMSI